MIVVSAAVALAFLAIAQAIVPVSGRIAGAGSARPAADTATVVPSVDKPNIVMLLLDDVPYLDPQTPWQATPEIAATFLQHGVTFSDFHGETPLCCPARAGFLTGLHTYHHHVTWNSAKLLNPKMTLATALHDDGYYTFLVGKYLNLYNKIAPREPPGWDGFHATAGSPLYYDYDIWNNGGAPKHYGSRASRYSTDVLTRKTIREIHRAPADKPLFAWIGLNATHGPMTPAPRDANASCSQMPLWTAPNVAEGNVADKPLYIRKLPRGPKTYDLTRLCRVLMSADDSFAAIRDALKADGRLSNTVFVLASDNGMGYGAHRIGLEKRAPYTTQIPFFVSWPAALGTEPRTIHTRLENIDFAPTMCALAGCTLGPYPKGPDVPDGENFAGLLLGTDSAPSRDAVLSGFPEKRTTTPQWDAVTTTPDSPLAFKGCDLAEIGGCIWHYVRYETGEKELYDDSHGPCWNWSRGQAGDPCELYNRADGSKFSAIQAALDHRLDELLATPP